MSMNTRSQRLLSVLGVLVFAGHAAAQNGPPAPPPTDDNVVFLGGAGAAFGAVSFVRGAGRVVAEPVTGKPYSADAVTETVQVLADGNRIVNGNRTRTYRDGEGRTRTEQTLSAFGPWSGNGSEPVTIVTIDDPVAKTSYFLDPRQQTAREVRPFRLQVRAGELEDAPGAGAPPTVVATRIPNANVLVQEPAPAPPGNASSEPPSFEIAMPALQALPVGVFSSAIAHTSAAGVNKEDLGEQVLEGVTARGTRVTQTIPAGAIGNERPIETVTETWYSDEIAAMVSSRTYDPRVGETTYRLVNVVLGEPSPDLFVVPQDYQLVSDALPPAAPAMRALPPGGGIGLPANRVERRVFMVDPGEPQRRGN